MAYAPLDSGQEEAQPSSQGPTRRKPMSTGVTGAGVTGGGENYVSQGGETLPITGGGQVNTEGSKIPGEQIVTAGFTGGGDSTAGGAGGATGSTGGTGGATGGSTGG